MKHRSRYVSKPSQRWAYCDVCDMKFHIKDLIKVEDKYNRLYGKIVCKADYSPTNAQDRPLKLKEKIVSNTDIMRPRKQSIFLTNQYDDRVPGKCGEGWAIGNPVNSYIDLYWNGPEDQGSSAVIGYKILISHPQFAAYSVLVNNTNDPAAYYQDTQTPVTYEVTYRVAAINSFGMGEYSDDFYWPSRTNYGIDPGLNYAITSPTKQFITTGIGQTIIVQL